MFGVESWELGVGSREIQRRLGRAKPLPKEKTQHHQFVVCRVGTAHGLTDTDLFYVFKIDKSISSMRYSINV
jgi:hypothetical protein